MSSYLDFFQVIFTFLWKNILEKTKQNKKHCCIISIILQYNIMDPNGIFNIFFISRNLLSVYLSFNIVKKFNLRYVFWFLLHLVLFIAQHLTWACWSPTGSDTVITRSLTIHKFNAPLLSLSVALDLLLLLNQIIIFYTLTLLTAQYVAVYGVLYKLML